MTGNSLVINFLIHVFYDHFMFMCLYFALYKYYQLLMMNRFYKIYKIKKKKN